MNQAVEERGTRMSQEINGVTLRTLPDAVRQFNLRPDQKFTIVIETDEERKVRILRRMDELATKATALARADGIVTEEDVGRFLAS